MNNEITNIPKNDKKTFEEKTLVLLGYNDVKEQIKTFASSGLGKNLISEMHPEVNPIIILNNYEETVEAVEILRDGTGVSLGGINDISPFTKKLEVGQVLQPDELLKMVDFLRCMRNIKKSMLKYEFIAPRLYSYSISLESFKGIEEEIEYCIEGSIVSSRASSTLRKVRDKINSLHSKRIDKLNKFLVDKKNAKHIQENFYSQRDERFVIPIKAASRKFVEGSVVDSSATGSTVYVEIDSIKELTVEIIMLKAQEQEECYQVLLKLSNMLLNQLNQIEDAIRVIAKYDFIFSRAKYSMSIGGNEIKITDDEVINLKKARYPALGKDAVPLDLTIGKDYRSLIITGPNTGGKTVTLKTVGLMCLLTQSGILPPVEKGSSISIFNKVLVDIGDSQSVEQSLSTFSGHMKSLVNILNKTSRRTLVIIDEIGTGTDPLEGAALGVGILEGIYDRGAITLATTHYSKIKEYSEEHPGYLNASMDFDRETLRPLYKLLIGVAGESHALWISKRLGLDEKVLARVKSVKESHEIIRPRKISTFSPKKSRIESRVKLVSDEDKAKLTETYNKGDRVLVNEKDIYALIFEDKKDKVVIFYDEKYEEVSKKRITLDNRREVLYPLDYDLDQLFISFKRRKLDKDIKRGGFKNLAELKERFNDLN